MECRTAGREIIWALQRHGHFENQDGRLAQLVSAQALPRLRDALRRGGGDSGGSRRSRSGGNSRGRPPRSSSSGNDGKRRSGRRRGRGRSEESNISSSSSSVEYRDNDFDETLQNMFDEMCERDWRKRKVALERLTVFVEKADARSLSSRRLVSIFDQYVLVSLTHVISNTNTNSKTQVQSTHLGR